MAGFIEGAANFDEAIFVTSMGDNNDVQMMGGLLEVVVSNDMDAITGIAPTGTSPILFVVNVGPTNNLVVKNNSSSSAAGNRILMYNNVDWTVPPFQMLIMGWSTNDSAWHAFRVPLTSTPNVIDGTYTVGIGPSTNGTITVEGGVITAIQQAT